MRACTHGLTQGEYPVLTRDQLSRAVQLTSVMARLGRAKEDASYRSEASQARGGGSRASARVRESDGRSPSE
jgi:hypothetical protein